MVMSFDPVEAFNLRSRPVISKRLDYQPCGRCEAYTIIKTVYEDTKDLNHPYVHYKCESCEWSYVEKPK